MRVPTRRSEALAASKVQTDLHLTEDAMKRLRDEHARILRERPAMIKEVQRTAEMGDFSENFAYQQAKGRLRSMNSRLLVIEDKLKTAIEIVRGAGKDGQVRIGSSVTVSANGKEQTFEILGSHETNPSRGLISHVSPLGVLLIGRVAGEEVTLTASGREIVYKILAVR